MNNNIHVNHDGPDGPQGFRKNTTEMIIRDKITPPVDAVSIEIVFSGSGDPADGHSIVGVTWRDKHGNITFSVGYDAEEHLKMKENTQRI